LPFTHLPGASTSPPPFRVTGMLALIHRRPRADVGRTVRRAARGGGGLTGLWRGDWACRCAGQVTPGWPEVLVLLHPALETFERHAALAPRTRTALARLPWAPAARRPATATVVAGPTRIGGSAGVPRGRWHRATGAPPGRAPGTILPVIGDQGSLEVARLSSRVMPAALAPNRQSKRKAIVRDLWRLASPKSGLCRRRYAWRVRTEANERATRSLAPAEAPQP